MTYTSIEQIETKFAKPAEDENQIDRNKRLKAKRQAICRFNDRQRSTQARSKTTMSSTSRKQKSRSEQTTEQKQNAKKQKRIKYAAKQEQLKKTRLEVVGLQAQLKKSKPEPIKPSLSESEPVNPWVLGVILVVVVGGL